VKNLENTVKKLLQLLEHYSARERDQIALLISQVFLQRLGVPPENVFTVLLNDVMVAKGTSLAFVTSLFRAWLQEGSGGSLDELMAVLRRGRVEDRLLEFFPQQRRSAEAFAAHFGEEGLTQLVEHSKRRFAGERAKELQAALQQLLLDGAPAAEAVETIKQQAKGAKGALLDGLGESEAVAAVWEALVAATQQQVGRGAQASLLTAALVKAARGWAKPLQLAACSAKGEAELMSRLQSTCYEDMALLKAFPELVRHLYDKDVLSEETILGWYKKGSNPKGRAVFVKDLEKFVQWLQEAEEESDDESTQVPAVVAAADAAAA